MILGLGAGILVAFHATQAGAAPPASAVLLDFNDDAQLARIRVTENTTIQPAAESRQGQPAALIVFAQPPEGLEDFPSVFIEGEALKVHDFSPYGALSLWVKNPGPDDAELSLSISDQSGHRTFPDPPSVTIRPGRWEQIVARLVPQGLDGRQISSVRLFQKENRRPVKLLIGGVQLLSPYATRLAGQRQVLNNARENALALGAQGAVEPQIAELSRGLDELEATAPADKVTESPERQSELARISTAAQELSRAITIRNGGKAINLSGPRVVAGWLEDPEKLQSITELTLSNTAVGDEVFPLLAAARNLEMLTLESSRFTGVGLDKMKSEKLRRLVMSSTGANDETLRGLRNLPGLEELQLTETRVTSGVFHHLDELKHLKSLALARTHVSDNGFAAIGKLSSLEKLDLSKTEIHGESLRSLEDLPNLKSLNLGDTSIRDNDLPRFSKLPQLENLTLENTPITGASLEQLKGLDKLTALNLDGTRIDDSGLRKFGKLPRLQQLELSGTRVSDASVTEILTGAHLNFLNLFQTNITDAALAPLLEMPSMDSMFLADTQISDVGLRYMRNLKALHALDLEGTQITDAGLQYLDGINMALLHIGKTRITAEGMKHIKTLTGLYNLDLSGTSVTDDSLENLTSLPHVIFLNLSGTRVTSKGMTHLHGTFVTLNLEATGVGDEGIEVLSALPKILRLNLNETAITDNGLKVLRKRGEINVLSLRGTRITDAGLADLGNNCGELDLSHNARITDQGVENLKHCAQLSRLGLAFTGVTDDAVKSLQALPRLTALDLSGTAIDDLGVQRLALLPQLKELNLSGTLVSDQAIEALLAMPKLRHLSLEGSRITVQGVSRLRRSARELTVDLVFPFVWGQPWSYCDAPAGSNAGTPWANPAAFLGQLRSLQGLRYLRVNEALLAPEVLQSLRDLPSLEDVSFAKTSITDETLASLPALSRVARLDFSDTRITDQGLGQLKDMPALSEMNLAGARINGSGFVHLASSGRLRALNLANTPLDDHGAAQVVTLKELRKLEAGGTRLTDAAIESLAQLPHLEYLDLYGTRVTDAGLAALGRMTALRYCYLTDTRVTDAGVEHLRGLVGLEELGLDGTRLTDEGLGRLTTLTYLRRLRVGRTNVTEAGLSQVALLPKLESLGLAGLPVTNAGLKVLAEMPALQSLDLSGTKIDDGALPVLARFPALTALDLRGAGLSEAALAGFRHAHPRISVVASEEPIHYPARAVLIAVLYLIAIFAICLYGIHRCWLGWCLLRDGAAPEQPEPAGRFAQLPRVTVQLPMFNERYVAERTIEAVCALDYPRELLQIQVLDDSSDDSADTARLCCERLAAAGHPVEYWHRTGRAGFKSGAMAAGLKTATGEFIVVFDADFVPAPDFLRQTIDYFTDPAVGMVQTPWSHLNRGDSLLTRLQAMFLDGHLVVEQAVRSRRGRWFNFNGTAGVWRRRCIEEAGGWQHETLTEDTDLSYRAQLKGWKFLYLTAARCRAELPATMTAFLGQQHRWTKGLIQTARKLLPQILASRAPWKIKLEAWIHLTSPVMYLVMFLIAAVALPAMFLATPFTERADLALAAGLGALLLGTFGAAAFYVVSQRVQGFPLFRTLLKIPLLMALGIGVCAVNARAVVEALLGIRSPFVRTPKFGARGDGTPDQAASGWRFPRGLLELLMAGVLWACFALSFQRPFTLIGSPFLLLFALGYSGVGLARVLDQYAAPVRGSAQPVRAWSFLSTPRRWATGAIGVLLLAGIAAAVLRMASAAAFDRGTRQPAALGLDLTAANWQAIPAPKSGASQGAIKSVRIERGSVFVGVEFDEKKEEGAIELDLDGTMRALGDALGRDRRLAFQVEYPARFTGEFQAFVRDRQGRSEYGNMQIIERYDEPRPVTVALIPGERTPAMGYQDKGFAPGAGIRQIGIKISAQSDRVRGVRYRPFRGTIRIVGVQVSDFDRSAFPAPETLPAGREPKPLPVLTEDAFLAGSGVDRPWPIGYAFSRPVTDTHKEELERTYAALEAKACRFTRVYVGDYRTGVLFDRQGNATGAEPQFLDYFDQLAEIANHHGVTVMFSLIDNAMLNGRRTESISYVRAGEASEAFVDHVLVELIKKLQGRQVIWDLFNEPENTVTVPLREIQEYVDRVLVAGRRADPRAKFTVVSRSRPEVIYWQGRGLDLYSHNIFNPRLLEESLTARRALDAPIMVAEMAPELASPRNLDALREAGYAGIGIWGWGTQDKYEWAGADLERIVSPLLHLREGGILNRR